MDVEKCSYILDVLTSHEFSWPFLEPVDPIALNIPTYFDFVKNPMDLRTMHSKLKQNLYSKPIEFRDDMILMFQNAINFNKDDRRENSVRILAQKLLQISLDLWDKVFDEAKSKALASMTTPTDSLLSIDKESSWNTAISDELCAQAKEQKLWEHWKKYSFVARSNRQKRMRHRLYGHVSISP